MGSPGSPIPPVLGREKSVTEVEPVEVLAVQPAMPAIPQVHGQINVAAKGAKSQIPPRRTVLCSVQAIRSASR